jgi:DNA (cytosine-5)-methyltransferase 1
VVSGSEAWGPYAPPIRRWERTTGRPAPAPTELTPKGAHRLSARAVEFMMGLPAGWVTDVPGLGRNDQLKALGNGVVPQQAAHALRLLLADMPAAEGAA